MVIVREGTSAPMPEKDAKWPPKSPHEALLSSPSGRKKYERCRERNSVSPSPVKRSSSHLKVTDRAMMHSEDDEEGEEDDDEETLQLKLQAIEARLKLKRLRNKSRQAMEPTANDDHVKDSSRPGTAAALRPEKRRRLESPPPSSDVQVPVSPNTNRQQVQQPRSPARVMLGIDKGLKARNVSLKRATKADSRNSSLRSGGGSLLTRPKSSAGDAPALKSFSERMAASRLSDRERKEKEERILQARSRGFGFNRQETNAPGPAKLQASATFGLNDPFTTTGEDSSERLPRFQSLPNLTAPSTKSNKASSESKPSDLPKPKTRPPGDEQVGHTPSASLSAHSRNTNTEGSLFDSFSGLHLSKRNIPHNNLTRTLEDKELFTIPRLLATIKGPHFEPPDIESDYVVFGVIASKSTPREHKNNPKVMTDVDPDDLPQRAKYMAMRLVDFKYEIDLFLFDTAFTAFWKLPVGTVVAILNPGIMPPRVRNSGDFALKHASSEDCILEIGFARDLGFCKSVKKDGRRCDAWVDKRKTEFCDFHVSMAVEKTKRGRMEVNTMTGMGKGTRGGRGGFGGRGNGGKFKDDGLRQEGAVYDRSLHETMYVLPAQYSRGRGAAQLLDDDKGNPDSLERGCSREELKQKRWAQRRKEAELTEKLASVGSGMGSEYMRLRAKNNEKTSVAQTATELNAQVSTAIDAPEAPDAGALGLLGNRATDVRLSPIKRKRSHNTEASEPVGWGGAYRTSLLSPKRKAHGPAERERSPVKKKARFMLEKKGIREPGRESLGNVEANAPDDDDDDDDDDLDII